MLSLLCIVAVSPHRLHEPQDPLIREIPGLKRMWRAESRDRAVGIHAFGQPLSHCGGVHVCFPWLVRGMPGRQKQQGNVVQSVDLSCASHHAHNRLAMALWRVRREIRWNVRDGRSRF